MGRTTSSTRRSPTSGQPIGPFSSVPDPLDPNKTVHLFFGADSTLGRDEFLRILYGAQVSFEVAILATIGAISIGTLLGSMAGYFRGWVDTIVSRVTEITMAFPALLFIIALASTVGDKLDNITFGGLFGTGVFTLVLIFTLFGWFYPARIIRAVVLSLREKEFVEAARMVGSSDWRIIRSHILPHLVAPIIVYSTLSVAGFILGEAGLSYLGVGHQAPDRELGEPAPAGVRVLHDAAVADGLARHGRPDHDAVVQPARRRPPRRVRPARQPLAAPGARPPNCEQIGPFRALI